MTDDEATVVTQQAPVVDTTCVAERLERYIRIPSVNPDLDGGAGEAALGRAVADDLADIGADVRLDEVAPGRFNVLAHLPGDPSAPTVLFDAHLDTMPPAGRATSNPIRDGDRVYGRGACDDKGSLAAMVEAAMWMAGNDRNGSANVIVSASVDEEVGAAGAVALREVVRQADLIVVGEPTGLDLGIRHKGTLRFEIEVGGVAAHSSGPERGRNAIYGMAGLLKVLQGDVAGELGRHHDELLGRSTLSVGSIRGGGPLNIVPDSCVIGVDVRRVPGLAPESVFEIFDRRIADKMDSWPVVRRDPPIIDAPALRTGLSDDQLATLTGICRAGGVDSQLRGMPYGTNASYLALDGTPAVVVGPGDIAVAHTEDEFVDVNEVAAAVRLYVVIAAGAGRLLRGRSAEPRH